MSNQKPKFIFAFANDEDALLQLKKEEYECWVKLRPVKDKIDILRLGLATLEKVYRVVNANHGNIQLFHYGGHAKKDNLLFNDTNVNAKTLAVLLGQEKNYAGRF